MIISPLTGSPMAEDTDFVIDYPATVDEPRTRLLEKYTIPHFADAATRDAAYAAAGGPVPGSAAFLEDISQMQSYSHVNEWAPIGNKRAYGSAGWGSSAIAIGTGRLNLVPSTTTTQGGIVWDAVNNGFMVAVGGHYLVNLRLIFEGLDLSASSQALAGDSNTYSLQGSLGAPTQNAPHTNTHTSIVSGILGMPAGSVICPWYTHHGPSGNMAGAEMYVNLLTV